jgi:hypothetical protein
MRVSRHVWLSKRSFWRTVHSAAWAWPESTHERNVTPTNRNTVTTLTILQTVVFITVVASAHAEPVVNPTRQQPADVGQMATREPPGPPSRDDDPARALERILVTRGGLLLPKYAMELEPRLLYAHSGTSSVSTERDTVTTAMTFRIGLPFDAQAELRVPYVVVDETTFDRTSGLGDVTLSFTKEILREAGRVPGLLATARWTPPTAEDDPVPGRLATGSGSHVVEGQLTAVKTQDPLVFFGTLSYTAAVGRRSSHVEVEPGDVLGVKLGSLLAASPQTSLGVALTLAFVDELKLRGRSVRSTDQTIGVVELSVGQIVSRRMILDVAVEIGVTDDAPDLGLRISLPIRF